MLKLFIVAIFDRPQNLPNVQITEGNLQSLVNGALALAGAVAVVFIVYGGIKFTLSQGNPDQTKAARNVILYALIGIVVVMLSFSIVNFVIGKF